MSMAAILEPSKRLHQFQILIVPTFPQLIAVAVGHISRRVSSAFPSYILLSLLHLTATEWI